MNNSEILFLYDAKMTNPNGNVDDENRPRMDYDTKRNLVSDVRLKRYVRDYLEWKGYQLYVGEVNGQTVTAEERLKILFKEHHPKKIEKLDKTNWNEELEHWMLDQLIDVRLFGATMTVKDYPLTYTGPVQFSWGYSLNPVRLMDNTITTHFSSKEAKDQGTMGKDYRVIYSFLAFYGQISGKRAIHTRMTVNDVALLDEAMIQAIPLMASRSKIGQAPRLYLRIEYKDDMTVMGDWRDCLPQLPEGLNSIAEVQLDVTLLLEKLERAQDRIFRLHIWQDPDLKLTVKGVTGDFSRFLEGRFGAQVEVLKK